MARIVFATFGSLGDIHPFLGLALELKRRGRDCLVVTSACYREKVEKLGLCFAPLRPDSTFVRDPKRAAHYMHPRWGTVRVGLEIVGPSMRQTYDDLMATVRAGDLIVSHPLPVYVVRLIAEKTRTPWISTLITPLGMMSAYDMSIIPVIPAFSMFLRSVGPRICARLLTLSKLATRSMARPWYDLRADIGLPPATDLNPLLDTRSPLLDLAMVSEQFIQRQPDWPAQTRITGFPHFDGGPNVRLPDDLVRFLDAGDAPIVFTRGDSLGDVATNFFSESLAAATRLGRRCVLVTGRARQAVAGALPATAISVEYAPFSALFPRASIIVHAGGIGSTGFAMASGRPSLVVPQCHDHFDNAARIVRLGIARKITSVRYTANRAIVELTRLLEDRSYADRATRIGQLMRSEHGIEAACDAIESILPR